MKVVKDRQYGSHERHRLDVYVPSSQQGGKPVLLFVHGGGFFSGDKGWSDKVRCGFSLSLVMLLWLANTRVQVLGQYWLFLCQRWYCGRDCKSSTGSPCTTSWGSRRHPNGSRVDLSQHQLPRLWPWRSQQNSSLRSFFWWRPYCHKFVPDK